MPVHTEWQRTVANRPGPNRRLKILHVVTARLVVAGTRRHMGAFFLVSGSCSSLFLLSGLPPFDATHAALEESLRSRAPSQGLVSQSLGPKPAAMPDAHTTMNAMNLSRSSIHDDHCGSAVQLRIRVP